MVLSKEVKTNRFIIWLIFLRFMYTLCPQSGYIHPDEFFQSVEIIAGNVLNKTVHRTWEFTCDHPLRTIAIPAALYGPVFLLLRALRLHTSVYLLQVAPRLVACCLGVACDFSAMRLSLILGFSPNEVLNARLLVATSYPLYTFLTRTLSNSVETALFGLLLVVCLDRRRSSVGTVTLSMLLVVGVFNRPTFALFAAVPVLLYCRRNPLVYVQVALYCLTMSAPFALVDSVYYHGDGETLALTPLNFLAYNLKSDNLANHGVHPRWTHALVNIPLLYGPAAFLAVSVVAFPSHRSHSSKSSWKVLTALIVVPLVAFSVFSHQEARFLLPLHVPVMLLATGGIWNWRRVHRRINRLPFVLWTSFNISLAVFFGLGHQSGVTRSLSHLHRLPRRVPLTAYYLNTYMPPAYLAPANATVVDLQTLAHDDSTRWRLLQDAVLDTPSAPPDHTHLLALPGIAAIDKCLDGVDSARITVVPEIFFSRHISTENLPRHSHFHICDEEGFTHNSLVGCKRPLVNITQFCKLASTEKVDFFFSLQVYRLSKRT